ncbi:hypothetical protein EV378_1219 [Pseudonocardia endophytica]|uniref:Uncharacterized protein n=2 Tax=Pseudonocardia endophytica TaxID=401976 RepID=A0A4R1I5R9_PSEEN|nr:hypothetical protein EV378_1219 [Pseudonocardia endophytica]
MRAAVVGVPVPSLEISLGILAWVVGGAGLDTGLGTLLVALGVALAGYLWVVRRRASGMVVQLHPERRRRMQRLLIIGAVGLVAFPILLAMISYGELGTALTAALVAVLLIMASSVIEERSLVAVGAIVLVIAAVGAFIALNSPGVGASQPVIGLGAGAVLFVAGMRRLGVLDELQRRVAARRRR